MPRKRDTCLSRIKQVERQYGPVRLATDRLLEAAALDPGIIKADMSLRDVRSASDGLEATYVSRLYAELETGLHLCWRADRKRRPPSRTEALLNGNAAREGVPNDLLQNAHSVRDYRIALIHERE